MLRVLAASAEEIAAHDAVIDGLQKASGGKAVWAKLAADAASGG
jgi:hypothetical protein